MGSVEHWDYPLDPVTGFTDRLVAQYNVRLLQTERSERVPSGLLVAEYGEHQMVGEKDNGLEQSSVLMDDAKK
jgi:hypothetical protein